MLKQSQTCILYVGVIALFLGFFVGIDDAYAVPSVKFDQLDKIVIDHSDYVTLVPDGGTTTVIITNNANSDPDTNSISITLSDESGHFRSLVHFASGHSSTDESTRTLGVNLNDEVQVEISGGSGNIDTATIVDGSGIQKFGYRVLDPTRADCDDLGGDADADGICFAWEQDDKIVITTWPGFDGDSNPNTQNYTFICQGGDDDLDCTDNFRDIFVEIDYMQGHRPNEEAIENVKAAFEKAPPFPSTHTALSKEPGIFFHYQIDDTDTDNIFHDPDTYFPGVNHPFFKKQGFDQIKAAYFGKDDDQERTKYNAINANWWAEEGRVLKKQIFHYGLFVHGQPGSSSSGIAELAGNDFMISLGSFDGNIGNYHEQEGTLMHEIGHNLGLWHGGGDNTNCKPNYLSVMSYARQTNDLFGTGADARSLDFSRQALGSMETNNPPLVENALDEPDGIEAYSDDSPPNHNEKVVFGPVPPTPLPTTGVSINWNQILPLDENNITVNVNDITYEGEQVCTSTSGTETLTGYDDWDIIDLGFRLHSGNFADGKHGSAPSDTGVVIETKNMLLEVTNPHIPGLLTAFSSFSLQELNRSLAFFNLRGVSEEMPQILTVSFLCPGPEAWNVPGFPRHNSVPISEDVKNILRDYRSCQGGPEPNKINRVKFIQENIPDIFHIFHNFDYDIYAYGLKGQGVQNTKHGSATGDIVCGDKLCKDELSQLKTSTIVQGGNEDVSPESLIENPFKTPEGLTAENVKTMRLVKIESLKNFVKNLDDEDFVNGKTDKVKLVQDYSQVQDYIKNKDPFKAVEKLDKMNLKVINDTNNLQILQREHANAKSNIALAVPEFEAALLILIPTLLITVFFSKMKKTVFTKFWK